MRCLVLGGRGFIGSQLVKALLKEGHFVRSFDRVQTGQGDVAEPSRPNYEFLAGDFTLESDLEKALSGCDVCFHLVSTTLPQTSNDNIVFDVDSNIIGSVRLLSQAVKAGVRKIVFVSSGGTVYGVPRRVPIPESHPTDPICSYGITKLAIEKYLRLYKELHGLDYTVLRLANPYGEGQRLTAIQGAVAVFLGKALRRETIEIWGDGSVVRDYLHIQDVVNALILAATTATKDRVLNIGSGHGMSLNDILDGIETALGYKTERRYLPGRPFDVPVSVLDIGLASSELGWTPQIGFEAGIRRFEAWVRNQGLLDAS